MSNLIPFIAPSVYSKMQFPKTFTIIVKPNMPKTEFLGFDKEKNAYRMSIHAPPEKGKANMEVIKFFKKEFKLNISIISGLASKEKLIRVIN
jgi:uncharacterized protein (TIGR00251 family)